MRRNNSAALIALVLLSGCDDRAPANRPHIYTAAEWLEAKQICESYGMEPYQRTNFEGQIIRIQCKAFPSGFVDVPAKRRVSDAR
jgi:hypothetical protein